MSKLVDSFNREITYLRVSVTDHCNYHCTYCRTKEESGSKRCEILSYEQIARIIRIFTELGVEKVRLTGGEPLVRKDITKLIKMIDKLPGLKDLALSTNAHLLKRFAKTLKTNGVKRLNISLDTLDKEKFKHITQGGNLAKVLAGIDEAIKNKISPIKINMVVMRDFNDNEIETMLDYAIGKNIQLRFIETMPIGEAGLSATTKYYPKEKIMQRVKNYFTDKELVEQEINKYDGPATIYNVSNTKTSVGIISAVSKHFCKTCNRVRLTAKGELVLCLGQEDSYSIRDDILLGKTDKQIKYNILKAILKKPEKHEFNTNEQKIKIRKMVAVGG